MLSWGQWHEQVPTDERDNLLFRRNLNRECVKDQNLQRGVRYYCKNDIIFYVNAFVWQFNPKAKRAGEVGPFIAWDFQQQALLEMLYCIETDEDLLIEKSRQMGASWMLCIAFEWLWHWHDWKSMHFISRTEEMVESDKDESLFWKIDFIHRCMPTWLMPKKWTNKKMLYRNGDTNSSISGEASVGEAGVGGNKTAMGIDEFSRLKHGKDFEVLHHTSNTTGCRIFNGTHLGLDTAMYELSQRPDIRKLMLHWTQHPIYSKGMYRYDKETNQVEIFDTSYEYPKDFVFIKDGSPTGGPRPGVRSPWYDKECKRKGSARAIAMDLDIDPRGSVSQVFDPLLIRRLKTFCRTPLWTGDLVYDRDSAEPKELQRREGGLIKLWYHPTGAGKIHEGRYCVGADLSVGQGRTPSCLSVVNMRTGEKIMEYANAWIDPKAMAHFAVAVCRLFANEDGVGAKLIWECQGPGAPFGVQVVELGYRNLYYRTNDLKPFARQANDTPGWYPSPSQIVLLIEDYRAALTSRFFMNFSEDALNTCLAFKYDARGKPVHGHESSPNDPSGAYMNHGDMVVADALAWKLAKAEQRPMKQKEAQEVPEGSFLWRRNYRKKLEQERIWWD